MSKKERILMIDDDLYEAQTHIDLLMTNPSADTVEFVLRSPETFKDVSDYLKLIKDTDASAIIIDQRLGDKSSAAYNGLELADQLRNPLPLFPIFILTKYASQDSIEAKGASLDDVMEKIAFHKNSGIYMTRLLRAIGRYKEASSSNRKRLDILLQKAFDQELTAKEHVEVNALRSELMWLTLNDHQEKSKQLQQEIDVREQLLKELKKDKK